MEGFRRIRKTLRWRLRLVGGKEGRKEPLSVAAMRRSGRISRADGVDREVVEGSEFADSALRWRWSSALNALEGLRGFSREKFYVNSGIRRNAYQATQPECFA
jgi:hypothetical protein